MDYKYVLISIFSTIQRLLGSHAFLDAHRYPNRFVRNRKLSVYQVIMYLLHTSKQVMHTNIDRMMDLGSPLDFPDVCKQALSHARQGIMPSLFSSLFDVSVDAFYQGDPVGILWRGVYRVFAIDGSKVQLPRAKSNFEKFGEMFSKKNPGKRWSMATVSIIYDVCNDYICHGLIRPYLASERAAAREHCRCLEETEVFSRKNILVFDRGYFSEDMFRYFSSAGYFCVMRLKEGYKLAKSCTGGVVSTLCGSKKGGTEDVSIRVVAVPLGDGTTEYLATNIFDVSFSIQDFKELYFLRWGIEQKYDELKNKLLLEEFSGATSTSVEQEFFINLLYANLASLVKSESDPVIEQNAKEGNDYRYQANRSYIFGRLKDIFTPALCRCDGMEKINRLFARAPKCKSQVQPDRSDPRSRVKRDWTRHNNRKTAI